MKENLLSETIGIVPQFLEKKTSYSENRMTQHYLSYFQKSL